MSFPSCKHSVLNASVVLLGKCESCPQRLGLIPLVALLSVVWKTCLIFSCYFFIHQDQRHYRREVGKSSPIPNVYNREDRRRSVMPDSTDFLTVGGRGSSSSVVILPRQVSCRRWIRDNFEALTAWGQVRDLEDGPMCVQRGMVWLVACSDGQCWLWHESDLMGWSTQWCSTGIVLTDSEM